MGLITWALNKAYTQKHINQMRDEHLAWAKKAATQFGTTWWTIAPIFPAADSACIAAYDVHGEYTFNRWSRAYPTHLEGPSGVDSWRIWWHHGPLTSVPQQTTASYEAARLGRHHAEMARAEKAVQAAINEVWALYPASAKALVNA